VDHLVGQTRPPVEVWIWKDLPNWVNQNSFTSATVLLAPRSIWIDWLAAVPLDHRLVKLPSTAALPGCPVSGVLDFPVGLPCDSSAPGVVVQLGLADGEDDGELEADGVGLMLEPPLALPPLQFSAPEATVLPGG